MSDRTSTERLRELLGALGIFCDTYIPKDNPRAVRTCWKSSDEQDGYCYFDEEVHDVFSGPTRITITACTPEQAVEATMGRGECHAEQDWDNDETPQARWWRCDACGGKFVHLRGLHPSYCPNCGRKVVDE